MSELVKVKYVGPEVTWFDYLYGSGATWEQGGVVAIEKVFADKLLRHPEFQAAPLSKKYDVAEPPKEPEEVEEPPMANLEAMTKAELSSYAHRNFGVVIPKTETAGNMRNTIRLQMGKRVA